MTNVLWADLSAVDAEEEEEEEAEEVKELRVAPDEYFVLLAEAP